MNRIQRLQAEVARAFPNVETDLATPVKAAGKWFLDIKGGPRFIGVVWQEGKGFGISTPGEDDFGVGADEAYPTVKAILHRVKELLETGESTSAKRGFRLAELRRMCGVSQVELAERLGVTQSNIVRIEGRDDVLLSTMARSMEALGITLEIRAKLPSGEVREILV